jgi:hypothetical protein
MFKLTTVFTDTTNRCSTSKRSGNNHTRAAASQLFTVDIADRGIYTDGGGETGAFLIRVIGLSYTTTIISTSSCISHYYIILHYIFYFYFL